MRITINEKMGFGKMFLFSLPSIIMFIFIASYGIVDAIFVSNFVGTNALSALNITYPITTFFVAIGVMFGTGGSALVSKMLGEKQDLEARKAFTLIVVFAVILSIIVSSLGLIFIDPLLKFLGADSDTFSYSKDYMRIILIFAPFGVLQMMFQSFFIVISRPLTGLIFTFSSGLANIFFDWFFICVCDLGISGAGYGTIIGFIITAVGGLIIFSLKNHSLRFSKFNFRFDYVFKSMLNGSSEMVINLAASITTLVFNLSMGKLAGSKGIAAITVILYIQFLMQSLIIGFSQGVAPIFSYNYGEKEVEYLKKSRNKSLIFILITSIVLTAIAYAITIPLNKMFSNGDKELYDLIMKGNFIFSICYLFAGFNIYLSSLFTALNDGITSAIIAFCRTFLFILIFTPIFAKFWGTTGVFLVIPVAEFLTFIVAMILLPICYKRDIKKCLQSAK